MKQITPVFLKGQRRTLRHQQNIIIELQNSNDVTLKKQQQKLSHYPHKEIK